MAFVYLIAGEEIADYEETVRLAWADREPDWERYERLEFASRSCCNDRHRATPEP